MSSSTCFPRFPKVRLALGAGCLAFAGCAVGPDYHRPEVAAPAAFRELAAPAAAAPLIASAWWTLFGDEQLTRLSQQVLAANLDIKAAMARVDMARAAARGAQGSYFPSLSLDPSVRRARTPAANASGGNTSTNYLLPLDLSYEVDIWGRLRRQTEYYQNLERASATDLAVVRQTVLADLAQGYFTLQLLGREKDILTRTVALYRQQLELTQGKARVGLAPQTDVLQSQTQIDQAETQLIELERSRAKQEHAIALLVGSAPSEFSLDGAAPAAIRVPEIPVGLPASLLSRRPDVAEAELKLIAANAQVGGATASFYPTLSLTGAAGFENLNVNQLTNWESRIWSIAPGLTLPIFEGGKLTAALAQAKANYEQQVATYRSAVIGAYRDVEDELSDLRLLARESEALNQTLNSAKETVRLTQLQYQQGLASSLNLITANQTLLNTELSLATAENNRLVATVLLIKAVGGGWSPGSVPAGAK